MSVHRTECVIEGEARPEWRRLPVLAVVVVGFLLAAIVGMTSAASPWLPTDGGDSSPPAIVGKMLAVALAAGLCILLGLIWIHTPRRSRAKKRGGPALATEEAGSGLRAGAFVLIGGILVVVVLVLAFWFLLEQADLSQPAPPSATTIGETPVSCVRRSHPRPRRRLSTGSCSVWRARSPSSFLSRSSLVAGSG